jgi:hypothetical protein
MAIQMRCLDELIGNAKSKEDVLAQDVIIKQLQKRLIGGILQSEMTYHLGTKKILESAITMAIHEMVNKMESFYPAVFIDGFVLNVV